MEERSPSTFANGTTRRNTNLFIVIVVKDEDSDENGEEDEDNDENGKEDEDEEADEKDEDDDDTFQVQADN